MSEEIISISPEDLLNKKVITEDLLTDTVINEICWSTSLPDDKKIAFITVYVSFLKGL